MILTHTFDYLKLFQIGSSVLWQPHVLFWQYKGDERIIIRMLRFESDLARKVIHGIEVTIQEYVKY